MKAYIINVDDNEGYCGVFFANKPSQAKSQALSETSYDYIDLKCRRDPSLDKFAPGPIPIKKLIKKGWWFPCFGCGERIDEDGYYCKETNSWTEPIYINDETVIYGSKGQIFCCQDCLEFTLPQIKYPIRWDTTNKEYLVSNCDMKNFIEILSNSYTY